jgi:TRAP transporter TAXI family solute receptor
MAGLAMAQDIRFFRIGTGSTAGVNFPIGGLIASALSNPPGSRDCDRGGSCGVPGMIAVAQATQGSEDNAREVGNGHLDAGIIQADVASLAYNGKGSFAGNKRQESLRALASLYPETLQIVVRRDSKITSLAGLKGKRVSLDTPASGTQPLARAVLGHAGIKIADIKPVYVDISTATDLMRNGKIDALLYVGGAPSPAIAQLADMLDLRLLPVPETVIARVTKAEDYYSAATLPAETYKGVEEIVTLSVRSLFVVNEKLSDDLAYNLLRALWHKSARAMFSGGHPQGKMIRLENALDGITIPLHPGATRYYAEAGLLDGDGKDGDGKNGGGKGTAGTELPAPPPPKPDAPSRPASR